MATAYMSEHASVIHATLDEMNPIRVGDLVGRETGILRRTPPQAQLTDPLQQFYIGASLIGQRYPVPLGPHHAGE
jgi:hypothetical protein